MSQHVVHLAVRTEDTTMLHERQAFRVVHGRWHPLHNGAAVPNEQRVLSDGFSPLVGYPKWKVEM